jgi:hypothetical protein
MIMENKNKDFAVFILTHGRADKVVTYSTLLKCGYTGDVVILIDNEDKQAEKYREKFGDMVQVFDKAAMAKKFDAGDNFKDKAAVVYARNACFDVAKKLGYKHFMQLDDDYTTFAYKFDENLTYHQYEIRDLDRIFNIMLKFYKNNPRILDLAMAQNGDFIGGEQGSFAQKVKLRRKCMNTHIMSTERRFNFVGKINEDVNTPVVLGAKGHLFLTVPQVTINQIQTQANSGGLTDIYLDRGTYIKSFYSILYNPSCVRISLMGSTFKRLHHKVKWNNAVPKILNEKYKLI